MPSTEKCPVCRGVGLVNRTRPGDAIVEYNIKCYGCGGKGWVRVSNTSERGASKGSSGRSK